MTMMRTIKFGYAICFSLLVLLGQNAIAQGKSGKSEQATEEQKEKQSELRQKHRPVRIKDVVEQKREEARAKGNMQHPEKGNKGNKGNNHQAEKGNNGKGNAYGKNKGELSGREFGQARAAQARLTSAEKKQKLTQVVATGNDKATEAKGRLNRAIEELERKRAAGIISDTEYKEKQVTISRTEKAIQILEEKVNAARVLVSAPVIE
ncbi:hypothetical protein WG947_16650 [Pontibacter sp. H259]|uniref:hypothetical protein n=1 Tax=Pontibacter sp. H259 TaxID=3133421 RepID=UPI0030BF07F1